MTDVPTLIRTRTRPDGRESVDLIRPLATSTSDLTPMQRLFVGQGAAVSVTIAERSGDTVRYEAMTEADALADRADELDALADR